MQPDAWEIQTDLKIRKVLLLLAFLALTGNLHAGIWDMFQSKPPFPEEVFTAMKAFAENNFTMPGEEATHTPTSEIISVTKMRYTQSFTTQDDLTMYPKGTKVHYVTVTYTTHDPAGVKPDGHGNAICTVALDGTGQWRFKNITAGDTAHNGIP